MSNWGKMKYYRPLPENVTVQESVIEGLGLHATIDIAADTNLGLSHIEDWSFPDKYIRTPLGGFINHSENPNCRIEVDGNLTIMIAERNIEHGEELTVDYRKQPYLEQPKEDWVK